MSLFSAARGRTPGGRSRGRTCTAPFLVVLLVLAFSWPVAAPAASLGAATVEAPIGPCGVPAGTLNQPVPGDFADATVTPRRDPGLTAQVRASEPLTAKSASERSLGGTALLLPPDPGDVHRVELLPRPPPAATVS